MCPPFPRGGFGKLPMLSCQLASPSTSFPIPGIGKSLYTPPSFRSASLASTNALTPSSPMALPAKGTGQGAAAGAGDQMETVLQQKGHKTGPKHGLHQPSALAQMKQREPTLLFVNLELGSETFYGELPPNPKLFSGCMRGKHRRLCHSRTPQGVFFSTN